MSTIKTWEERTHLRDVYQGSHIKECWREAAMQAEITELRERVAYLESYTESQKDAMRVTMDELVTVRGALKVAQFDLSIERELLATAAQQRDALQAKLSAVESQEPFLYWVECRKTGYKDKSLADGWAKATGQKVQELYVHPVAPAQQSAERTLTSLGYTNLGGEYWKPPLGKVREVQPVNELVEALEELMRWQVKNVKVWNNSAYDNASRALANAKASQPLSKEKVEKVYAALQVSYPMNRHNLPAHNEAIEIMKGVRT